MIMKSVFYLITVVIILMVANLSCKESDQDPVPDMPIALMEPVIFNFTGTWDSQCGQKSRSVMDSIRFLYPSTPVINVHINGQGGVPADPLSNSQSESLAAFFNVEADQGSTYHIPYTWFMCPGVVGGFNYSSNVYQDLSVSIDWTKEHLDPALALDIIPELSGNQLTVKIRTEAVQNIPMQVYLSVYITEDEVQAEQVDDLGLSPNTHRDVFRVCLNEFNGDKIADVIHYGDKNEFSYSGVMEQGWNKDQLKVTVIAWYKDNVYGNLVHLGKQVDLVP